MAKKQILFTLFLCALLCMLFAGCGTEDEASSPSDGKVEVTLPFYYFDYPGENEADTIAAAEESGYEAWRNEDGSYTYKMTPEQQQAALDNYKGIMETHIETLVSGAYDSEEYYPEIVDVEYSADYREILILCKKNILEGEDLMNYYDICALGVTGPLYIAYLGEGSDAKIVITIADVSSDQVYMKLVGPDDFSAMFDLGC